MTSPAPPVAPMLAKALGDTVPEHGPGGSALIYEPKWDGFRCLLFVDDDRVFVQSRSGEDLAYAFPEIVAAAAGGGVPVGTVLDGELVIARAGRLWFEDLGQRIRPRSEAGGWKIAELAEQHPASYVAFDLLGTGGTSLMSAPFADRRAALESLPLHAPFFRTPATTDPQVAREWFRSFEGAGLDGVVAKPSLDPYQPDKRAMLKVKHARTADVVVAGWRPHKQPGPDGAPVVGSLLLGLYDESGNLHHIGVASSFSAARRSELAELLLPLAVAPGEPHPWQWAESDRRTPGMQSRWSGGKDLSFRPTRPELVAEIGYDHMEGTRLRHVAKLVRFRPDRDPRSCTYDQLDRPVLFALADVVPGLG